MIGSRGWDYDLIVLGEPGSKSNQRRIVKFGGVSRLIKSEKALKYGKYFKEQTIPLADLVDCDVSLRLDVWYSSRRPDLASKDLVQDLLQDVIYLNDRQVKAGMEIWNLDKSNPRVRIRIKVLGTHGDKNISELNYDDVWGKY